VTIHGRKSTGSSSTVPKSSDGAYALRVNNPNPSDLSPVGTNHVGAPLAHSLAEPGAPPGWTIEKSAELYQIRGWGEPYFGVNGEGHVEVRPDPSREGRSIDLFALAQDLKARGLSLPLLIRFSDILRDRIRRLNECFAKAIAEYSYPGVFRGVYPVKVNQQRHVVEEVVEFGAPWSFGLEAGSKPELLIALANAQESGGLTKAARLAPPERAIQLTFDGAKKSSWLRKAPGSARIQTQGQETETAARISRPNTQRAGSDPSPLVFVCSILPESGQLGLREAARPQPAIPWGPLRR